MYFKNCGISFLGVKDLLTAFSIYYRTTDIDLIKYSILYLKFTNNIEFSEPWGQEHKFIWRKE